MTVCQFFLQGRCRFGQNCRFEHIYNNNNNNNNNSNNNNNNNNSNNEDRNSRNALNSQQLTNVVKQIVEEVILTEKGGQWPLSCFSPVKGGPNIPGWEDISPEEVRWKMYEARINGTLNQCNLEINQLYINAEKMRNLIKEPTMERVNLIVNLLKGRKEPTNTSSNFSSSSTSSSVFGGSLQTTSTQNIFRSTSNITSHGNIFGNSSSSFGNIFGGSNQTTGNVFGGSSGFSNQNIFGGSGSSNSFSQNSFPSSQASNQNVFSSSSSSNSGNIFSSDSVSGQNIFSKAADGNGQNITNAFIPSNNSGVQVSGSSIFGSNATFFQNIENQNQLNTFGATQNKSVFSPQNTFSKASNIFSTQQEPNRNVFSTTVEQNYFTNNQLTGKEFDSSVYSKKEDLTEEEINSFTSPTFVFGKIPVKPPLKEYCK